MSLVFLMNLLSARLRAWYPRVFPVNKFTFEEYQRYVAFFQFLQNMVIFCQETVKQLKNDIRGAAEKYGVL